MRRWELQHYGFECKCRACVDIDTPGSFGAASRERRWKMRELNQQLRVVANDQERLQVRLEQIAAMAEEGFCLPAMGDMYLEVARICERNGDLLMAVKAARKALENYTTCYGAENERTTDAAKSVRAFEKQLPKAVLNK
jgi:tetratricopeptide (TPR) repeat protein